MNNEHYCYLSWMSLQKVCPQHPLFGHTWTFWSWCVFKQYCVVSGGRGWSLWLYYCSAWNTQPNRCHRLWSGGYRLWLHPYSLWTQGKSILYHDTQPFKVICQINLDRYPLFYFYSFFFSLLLHRVPTPFGNLGNSWEFDLGDSQYGIFQIWCTVVGNPQTNVLAGEITNEII